MRYKEERATQGQPQGRYYTMTTTMSKKERQREKEEIQDRPEQRPIYEDNMRVFYKHRNSTARWIEIRTSHLDEATRRHHTLLYQNLHHVRQQGTRGGSHRGYFRRQYSYGTRTANRLVRQVLLLGTNYREEAASEIANLTIKQDVDDHSEIFFGTFVGNK